MTRAGISEDFHSSLQSDNRSGYFVSLAHGWSSGPTAWMMEQVLGIQPAGAGFSTVDIRPDLVDLDWAKGGEPTPQGLLMVDVRKNGAITWMCRRVWWRECPCRWLRRRRG